MKAAGVPIIRFHDLRHTFATIALSEKRQPVKDISEILGHASIRITLQIYAHTIPGSHDRAMDAVDEAFG